MAVARTFGNMTNVEEQLGNLQKAIELNEKALKIFVKVLGRHHVREAMTKENIAYVYERLGTLRKHCHVLRRPTGYSDGSLWQTTRTQRRQLAVWSGSRKERTIPYPSAAA